MSPRDDLLLHVGPLGLVLCSTRGRAWAGKKSPLWKPSPQTVCVLRHCKRGQERPQRVSAAGRRGVSRARRGRQRGTCSSVRAVARGSNKNQGAGDENVDPGTQL